MIRLTLMLALALSPAAANPHPRSAQKQLYAVRGEITKIKKPAKGMLAITIKPAKEFAEVTVLARENDFVGSAVGGAGDLDLFGLLTGDADNSETITAAELSEGDVVSAIYDPQMQNRAVELYVH